MYLSYIYIIFFNGLLSFYGQLIWDELILDSEIRIYEKDLLITFD